MLEILSWIETELRRLHLAPHLVGPVAKAVLVAGLLSVSFAVDRIARVLLLRPLERWAQRTQTKWDDVLVSEGALAQLPRLVPALLWYVSLPYLLKEGSRTLAFSERAIEAYMLLIGALTIDRLINVVSTLYNQLPVAATVPIKSYVQVAKIILYMTFSVLALTTLLNRTPWAFLSGLGAATAVLMLIFKDPILGFVSSIQISANDIVRPGDWIEVPKFAADGHVMDVSLTTVKIRNFDMSISTIPTYALVSESIRNWRGMIDAGGRRIKRAIYLDMNSVRFCDAEMLARFRKFRLLHDYLTQVESDMERHNASFADVDVVNQRRLTNLGTFRAYVSAYLRANPRVNQDLALVVRQLAPSPTGVGIEVYAFSRDIGLDDYEKVQADIFDHVLAIVPEFELRVFQNPAGAPDARPT